MLSANLTSHMAHYQEEGTRIPGRRGKLIDQDQAKEIVQAAIRRLPEDMRNEVERCLKSEQPLQGQALDVMAQLLGRSC